jgi:hypothetical protein
MAGDRGSIAPSSQPPWPEGCILIFIIKRVETDMYFLPSFKVIRGRLKLMKVNGKTKINNSYDDVVEIVKLLLRGAAFDEKWYLATHTDVAEAVKAGTFKSGRHHFIEVGYFEGRRPCDFEVDEKWYLETYPDVAEGISKGDIQSARQHFNEHGYEEGRFPAEW